MPTPPKPPEQRRRRNKEQPKRASATALPAANVRKAPPPPKWLPRKFHPAYREVWRASIANLWRPENAELVARLVVDRDCLHRLDPLDVPHALRSGVLQLERELLIPERAGRQSGITVRDEQAVVAVVDADDELEEQPQGPKRRTISRDRRDRILRAVPD